MGREIEVLGDIKVEGKVKLNCWENCRLKGWEIKCREK